VKFHTLTLTIDLYILNSEFLDGRQENEMLRNEQWNVFFSNSISH